MVEKDKKTTSEYESDKNDIPLSTSPLSKKVVSSMSPSASVPLSSIPPDLDNQGEVGPDSVVKATAMDALVIEMAEKNLVPEPQKEKIPENPISSSFKKIGETLGFSSKDKKEESISSFINVINEGLNGISKSSREEEVKPVKKGVISSAIQDIGETLGLSPRSRNKDEKESENRASADSDISKGEEKP